MPSKRPSGFPTRFQLFGEGVLSASLHSRVRQLARARREEEARAPPSCRRTLALSTSILVLIEFWRLPI